MTYKVTVSWFWVRDLFSDFCCRLGEALAIALKDTNTLGAFCLKKKLKHGYANFEHCHFLVFV